MGIETFAPKLFIACAAFGLFSCLARADFNLPLFVFAWFLWNHPDRKERYKLFLLVFLTGIVDLI